MFRRWRAKRVIAKLERVLPYHDAMLITLPHNTMFNGDCWGIAYNGEVLVTLIWSNQRMWYVCLNEKSTLYDIAYFMSVLSVLLQYFGYNIVAGHWEPRWRLPTTRRQLVALPTEENKDEKGTLH